MRNVLRHAVIVHDRLGEAQDSASILLVERSERSMVTLTNTHRALDVLSSCRFLTLVSQFLPQLPRRESCSDLFRDQGIIASTLLRTMS